MDKKLTLLVATDSPTVSTGFGHVCYEIITRLLKTGKYKIVVMGTNDQGEPHPLRGHPDLIIEPLPHVQQDPYGFHKMPALLKKYNPDVIWSLNDIYVWTADERHPEMLMWFVKHLKQHRPYMPWVGYFPVDGRPWSQRWVELISHMDHAAVFTDYGKKVMTETPNVDMSKIEVVYHGASHDTFYPLPEGTKERVKKELGVPEDGFLVGSVCFKKGTKVLMSDMTDKAIEDVQSGDKVINHLGEEDTVVAPMVRPYNGKMCKTTLTGMFEPIECTWNHPFFTVTKEELAEQNNFVKRNPLDTWLKDGHILKPSWRKMGDLKKGDYIATAIPKETEDVDYIDCTQYNELINKQKNTRLLPDRIKLDGDLCRLIGLFLAEGSYGYVNDRPVALSFALNTNEEFLANEIINTIQEKFGFRCNVRTRRRNDNINGEMIVEVSSTALALLFKDIVPCHDAHSKQLSPWMMKIDAEKQMEILEGWRLGDGCISKDIRSGQERMIAVSVSKKLIQQMSIIALRNYLPYCINKQDKELNGKIFPQYRFVINMNSKRPIGFINGDYFYRRIKENNVYLYEGDVYNFEVENQHSYTLALSACGAVTCKNCRNQPRKNIPRLIQIFKMFRDGYVRCQSCGAPRSLQAHKDCELCGSYAHDVVSEGRPDAFLYLHMNPMDPRGFRLPKIMEDNKSTGVFVNPHHDIGNGVPIERLNELYNALDVSILTTTAGGYELSVPESQAAGVPVICTSTTCIPEQMDNNKGYLVTPITHTILEDANHCHKHIIDIQGTIDTLEMAYSDWKNNSIRRQEIIKNASAFIKTRTWDMAADQFDEMITKSANSRLMLHKHLKKLDDKIKKNVMFVNTTDCFGKFLASLPVIYTAARNNPQVNFVIGVDQRYVDLVDKNLVTAIPFEKMWIDHEKIQKLNTAIIDISQMIDQYENATRPYVEKSWVEILAQRLNIEGVFIDSDSFKLNISDEVETRVKKLLESEDKFTVVSMLGVQRPNNIMAPIFWNKLNTMLGGKGIHRVIIGPESSVKQIDADVKVSNIEVDEALAILKNADCVITSDEDYLYTSNIFKDTKYIGIAGARKDEHNMVNDNIEWIYPPSGNIPCAPCWKGQYEPCHLSRQAGAACMANVNPGHVFTKVLKAKKAKQ